MLYKYSWFFKKSDLPLFGKNVLEHLFKLSIDKKESVNNIKLRLNGFYPYTKYYLIIKDLRPMKNYLDKLCKRNKKHEIGNIFIN